MKNSIVWILTLSFALAITGGLALTGCKTTIVVKQEKDKRSDLNRRANTENRDLDRNTRD